MSGEVRSGWSREVYSAWSPNWREVPLWAIFDRVKDVGHPNEDLLSVYRDHGVVRREGRDGNNNKTALDRTIYQLVHPGWFVVNRMKAWQGSVGVSRLRGIVSGHYICFRPKHHEDSRFLNWLLRSNIYATEYAARSRGVRPSQMEIDNDELRVLPIHLPPVEEQRRIADFLDAETSRIDALGALRSRQIGLVSAGWIATLSDEMDNLAAIHGSVRLRHWVSSIQQGWSPQCDDRIAGPDEWAVLKAGCVNTGRFDPLQHKALPPKIAPREEYLLKIGDLLMSRASGSPDLIGSIGVVRDLPAKLLLCDKIYRITPDFMVAMAEFLAYALRGYGNREHIKNGISGAEGMANNLPVSVVKDCLIPKAPIQSQAAVVGRLDRQAAAVESATNALRRSTVLLSERRQSLITAAVTGQFDVTTASGRNLTQGV